jgi:hypothetical protein
MENTKAAPEPRGFAEHTRKISSENAHQQGWGLNEEERRQIPPGKKDYEGGTDYDYGARDFGDEAVNTGAAQPSRDQPGREESPSRISSKRVAGQRTSASRG